MRCSGWRSNGGERVCASDTLEVRVGVGIERWGSEVDDFEWAEEGTNLVIIVGECSEAVLGYF